jgi:hypothetical protein
LSGGMLERFEALAIPTMYVFGATMAPETVRRIEDELTDTVVNVPGASHWVMHDKPGLFTDLVLEWTQRLGLDRVKLGTSGGDRGVRAGTSAMAATPVAPPLDAVADLPGDAELGADDDRSGWTM